MLPEVVSSLGFGGQVVTAATLLLVAVYLYRAQAIARMFAAVAGSIAGYALVLLVVVGIAIGLGWVDPRPSTMLEHGRRAWAFVTGRGLELVRTLLDVVR